ncbi:adenylate/guanylate cyclase domain-containing protein [Falsiphaeobacter marinintestinus]|uniref:adenylate/guanylate cyclase domain-containing protein n=1 Tax=Falsiphaeobacter marinintestinus TaxID=1492905 RepID=UPI0011B71EE8|nr:adenylate/guanylate cyclase domain-containing protein [Phaeobacter marinintestinus]
MDRLGRFFLKRPYLLGIMVFVAIAMLPLALFMDLRDISDRNLRHHATDFSRVMTSVRSYYAKNVVGRLIANGGQAQALHNYAEVPGAIPIPATLSLELGEAIGKAEGELEYSFVSDYPFAHRPPHKLDDFEIEALNRFREGEDADFLMHTSGSLFDRKLTLAMPVVMSGNCVGCHNSHAESTKTDWQVGDVRGLQTVTVHQPIVLNLGAFRWLLLYLAAAGSFGLFFALLQFRLARSFGKMNDELTANNAFLADVSLKISKYLSPQVYRSIFSGEKDVSISTERKKLTVFFSDIKDFTSTSEILQPEELTGLLNEYFTEMSRIAEKHGATIDKFIGDAIVAFFGDPETKGTSEDARACVRMALEMQARLAELELAWRARGLEHPFRARMGINTGYCNVGNFGSEDRMDYTIIGAEANLAARLEGIAEPGGIVLSYETYAHVRDMVDASVMDPVRFKGIARDVVPYQVDVARPSFQEEKVTLDLTLLDEATRQKVRDALSATLPGKQTQET